MAEQIQSIENQGGGKYKITYVGGSTSVVNSADAKAAATKAKVKITNPSANPTPSPGANPSTVINSNPFAISSGAIPTGGNPNAAGVQITDPNTGMPVSGELTVPTLVNGKVVNKSIAQLVIESKSAANLAKIKSTLVNAGILAKGTKSVTSVQNAWTNILVNSALTGVDPFKYIADLKAGGFGQDVNAQLGTRTYPTISNVTDAEASINKTFQDRLQRDATPAEIKAYTKTLNDYEAKNPKKVTYSESGQKTFGGLNIDQFLSDAIDKDKTLKAEADKIVEQSPDLTKRVKDKKVYDTLVAKAGGDPAKLEEALSTTAYGRGLQEYQAALAATALAKGFTNTTDELNTIAKDLYDKGIKSDSQVASDAITKVAKYGPNAKGQYTGTAGTTFDDLQKTAAANGLDLNKTFGSQLPNWIASINKGESLDTYKKIIRDTAKIGMPEKVVKLLDQGVDLQAIYTPYKNLMASTLEINPQTIDLNDPTLRSAITADKEVPLYEFERQLRKDNRWQYTQQANKEVGDATQQILKDFGFQG